MIGSNTKGAEPSRVLDALSRSLAIIEFDPRGTILRANENFCQAMGYAESDIRGQHHSMFVDPEYGRSVEYRVFWEKLGRGEFDAGEYKRFAKGGREIWIQASYNPITDKSGKVLRVVKVAADITEQKQRSADHEGKINAISRVQAVIEFKPSGEILYANENFLGATGYRLEEIKGQHHRMFMPPGEAQTQAYSDFWVKLGRGEAIAAEFKRVGKGGREIWIQASYNPILSPEGRVVKVVKFATDVTARVNAVSEIGAGLRRMAVNDLEHKIDHNFPPELEQMRTDFNAAVDTIKSTLSMMADSTNAIQSNAQELARSADDLSRRTEQQAASLEQTAAALDEITQTVRQSSESATHARQIVSAADADAKKSAAVVSQAVNAMDAISKSSNQIGQIIGVIDEIAFQTNLLALNAGVEAARAGDAGRGFAVVASEVRALAQRSAEAAKEIKSLISMSNDQVGGGVKLVAETGTALDRIVTQVAEINAVITTIAAGAQEQAVALNEVNAAINQMDQSTQQNAAMVEQSTAATHALSQEAGQLASLISNRAMRNQLEAAAPHAFHAPAPAPKRSAPQPTSRPQRVSNGSGSWQDF